MVSKVEKAVRDAKVVACLYPEEDGSDGLRYYVASLHNERFFDISVLGDESKPMTDYGTIVVLIDDEGRIVGIAGFGLARSVLEASLDTNAFCLPLLSKLVAAFRRNRCDIALAVGHDKRCAHVEN